MQERVSSFAYRIQKTLQNRRLLVTGSRVCVCLSGGPDSVSLLYAMNELKQTLSLDLCACHYNHHLRGTESDSDQQFCVDICKKLGITLYCGGGDVKALAQKESKSLETAAREARYAYFSTLCGIDCFATAHTKDDNAETVLQNLFRGSSVDGLAGIPEKRGNIIRPMLDISREEVMAYIKENSLSYVVDSTNLCNDYNRNFIRLDVLPLIKQRYPAVVDSITRLSKSAKEDKDYFKQAVAEYNMGDKITPSVLKRKIASDYQSFCKNTLSSSHINQIASAVEKSGSRLVVLPEGVVCIIENNSYRFQKQSDCSSDMGIYMLNKGKNRFCDGLVEIIVDDNTLTDDNVYKYSTHYTLDFDKIIGNVYYRKRQIGDRILCMGVNKSLKKLMIDKKIPTSLRDCLPVFFDDAGIIFVPFVACADRVYHKGGAKALELQITVKNSFSS